MAADEALTGVGELLFSLIVSYLGAMEIAFVARHLYHLCRHPGSNQEVDAAADSEELPRMRERLDRELKEAAEREAAAGGNAMQDGVLYSNGFRVESPEAKKKALAEELERQRRIEEATRKQLAEAEHKLAEDRLKAAQEREAAEAAESARNLIEAEKQREAAQREREEAEERQQRERHENERKLIEAEKQREENERRMRDAEQQQRERQENERKLFEAEKQREAEQQEHEKNEKKLREAEWQRQASQRQREVAEAEAEERRELEENERKLHKAEEQRQDAQRQRDHEEAEHEAERRIFQGDEEQAKRDAEIVERLLAAERARKLSATESELEEEALVLEQARRLAASKEHMQKKQKSIEENARLFMEAEEEMVMVQQRMLQAQKDQEDTEYAGSIPVVEEPCVRKILPPRFEEPSVEQPLIVHRVKTQFGQTSVGGEEPYARSKTLMFPGVSDEGSSVEPNSSQKSSFSTQVSEEPSHLVTEGERQEPEGEDNVPDVQYTEDYLRSLDGIKSRPLVREDGSGRRRAFKKRRSSGSSNSSRESRASRDEELKMFTSLEEEELRHGDKDDYNPIKYSTEPSLRVRSSRRHKRSPAKDANPQTDASGSLEMLGEESTNPWGEVVPDTYKNTEFWKREKALSIDEEELELEKQASGEGTVHMDKPKASSFEEATEAQNKEAASSLQQQRSKEEQVAKDTTGSFTKAVDSSGSDIKSNLQTSQATEEQSRLGSPSLRRSPRIDEMDHYEERWRESEEASHPSTPPPRITVHQPDTAPWRDQYGLMVEGLSDFYDFSASVNRSRSRSTSRNVSPQPKNVANRMDVDEEHTLEVYDDGLEGPMPGELNCELVLQMLESTINGSDSQSEQLPLQNVADDAKNGSNQVVPMIFEPQPETRSLTPPRRITELEQDIQEKDRSSPMEVETNGFGEAHNGSSETYSALPQPVIEINAMAEETIETDEEPVPTREEMRLFVETLRAKRNSRSQSPGHNRSRSRSPLPTADNIARSLEQRRQKRIKQNDEFFEKLKDDEHSSGSDSPVTVPSEITLRTSCEEHKILSESLTSLKDPDLMISPALNDEEPLTAKPPKINVSLLPLPIISIEGVEKLLEEDKEPEPSPESVAKLVEQLRLNRCRSRSRSCSRSPLPTAANLEHSLQKRREKLIAQNDELFEQMQLRATTPEPEIHGTNVENVYERSGSSRDMRSLSPSRSGSRSRSRSRSGSLSSESEYADDFHVLLNLEGCEKRTLFKSSEELESVLAHNVKQHEFDLEALHQLQNASEEIELRVEEEYSQGYERTFSEAARELRSELLVSGFKRSRYVGESIDLGVGPEFEQHRRENAQFQRSHSPSPSLDISQTREHAAAQREMQSAILNSLVNASSMVDEKRLGAKPKKSVSSEPQVIKEEQLDDMRHRTAEFQRSRSQSRSPGRDAVDAEAAKREPKGELLDQLAASSANFQKFSRYLNADFLDSERRASDSAIIQLDPLAEMEPEEYHHLRRFSLAQEQPVEEYPSDECVYISQIEVRSLTGKRTWIKEDFYTHDLASLELNFDDLPKKSEYETEERSWARAVLAAEAEAAEFDETSAIYNYDIVGEYQGIDEVSSNDSEDERQTVVGIDDDDDDNDYDFELDEGISDNNERTQPTDESHHDTSECEEAERNADRYANRDANDWEEIDNVEDYADYHIDDGAVGGSFSDPDSYIEQIYNDAVKNRKQSGILRDFETMVQEQLPGDNSNQSESDKEISSSDSERYALWAKTRELDRNEESNRHRDIDISLGLLESERQDTGMRYLGDAQVAARHSTRLRTRYGYSPKLQAGAVEDDIEVDLNYKPKREYNWRKNFKLDDSEPQETLEESSETPQVEDEPNVLEQEPELLEQDHSLCVEIDPRRFSFGGESITLFSRSPDRELLSDVPEETLPEPENAEVIVEAELPSQAPTEEAVTEKPKKKKSKKKTRKNSKTEDELRDDNDSDNQEYNRRSFAVRDEGETLTETSKRKVRSRRSSKSNSANEEPNGGGLFSPRNSIGFVGESTLQGISEFDTPDDASLKKKTKKRKKSLKDTKEQSIAQAAEQAIDEALADALAKIAPISISVSTNLTPASTQQNLLSSISAGHSLCLTPASSFEEPPSVSILSTNDSTAVIRPERSVVDTFDILKDANFYPLF